MAPCCIADAKVAKVFISANMFKVKVLVNSVESDNYLIMRNQKDEEND